MPLGVRDTKSKTIADEATPNNGDTKRFLDR